jgi:hypothetical protein
MKELPASVKDQLISDIIDAVSLKEDGTPSLIGGKDKNGVSHDGALSYNNHLWFLYSMDDFGVAAKLNNLRWSVAEGGIFGMEFLEVFAKLKKENRRSFGDFEEEFDAMVERIKRLPQKRFTLVFALNFKVKEALNFEIDIRRFRIIPYDTFKREFIDFDTEIQQATDKIARLSMEEWKRLSEGFSFFIIDVFSRNRLFARDCASKILECLLGLLVFSKAKTSGNRYAVAGSRIKSKLALSTVFTFESGERLGAEKYSLERPSYEEIEEDDLRNLGASLSYFNEIPHKAMMDVIFSALIPYYWASVDEDLDGSAFKYWICIEQLLLKSPGTPEAEIVRRIKSMPVEENVYLDYQIDGLYRKRNRYAHEFGAEFHQIERNLAKSIADVLLEFLLVENQSFSNKREFVRFSELIQKDSAELKRKLHDDNQELDVKKMARLILRLRE